MIHKLATAAAVAILLSAGAAQAEIVHFSATLAGASSPAKGELSGELETVERVFVYRANFTGLSGPPTMAHFHGPAAPGANGPPVVVVKDPTSPVSGTAILTPAQEADLLAGKWYFNVHTAANPGGEIRGQVERLN